jgi:hypothetical protein
MRSSLPRDTRANFFAIRWRLRDIRHLLEDVHGLLLSLNDLKTAARLAKLLEAIEMEFERVEQLFL